MQWASVLLSEALLAHDVYVCLERPSGALPPEIRFAEFVLSDVFVTPLSWYKS